MCAWDRKWVVGIFNFKWNHFATFYALFFRTFIFVMRSYGADKSITKYRTERRTLFSFTWWKYWEWCQNTFARLWRKKNRNEIAFKRRFFSASTLIFVFHLFCHARMENLPVSYNSSIAWQSWEIFTLRLTILQKLHFLVRLPLGHYESKRSRHINALQSACAW